jgi:tetratricopeptide (TPR) repeat protein
MSKQRSPLHISCAFKKKNTRNGITLRVSLSLSEKARIEVAHCLFSDAGKKSAGSKESFEKYQDAMDAYNDVIKRNAKSELVVEARFGVANCLESMDQLDRALQAYENLRSEYPSPKLVQLKVMRIQERRAQKNR